MTYSPEYQAWRNMKDRCRNPKHRAFARYGGRGIDYDPRWEQFDAFLADMGHKPFRSLSLERLDNDRGYYRENCTWATREAQARNRRSGKLSQVKARNIRRMNATGRYLPHELMLRFDVTWQSIKNVITRRTWT
jgi:hypothetical protein